MAYRGQRYYSSESESSSDDDRSVASSNRSVQSARSNNSSRAEVWCCRECSREFSSRQGLNCHITTMHERARPSRETPELERFGQLSMRSSDRFQCTRCGSDYATQGNLNRHLREYHGAGASAAPRVNVRSQTNVQNNVRIQNNYFYIKKN
ncbi:hypothetical protein MSG28_016037 [Choristoneura fumiferana]|uniref:Uncharacterized protein n=1 Tax=Choristoneura fumiferana TaxID=7141 RepID=A0ACC0K505_CHOFU|nr:hypothetical protein MSG28_016037 [Choristoneura fumiferana]